jgi:hypothetical protein
MELTLKITDDGVFSEASGTVSDILEGLVEGIHAVFSHINKSHPDILFIDLLDEMYSVLSDEYNKEIIAQGGQVNGFKS